MLSDITLEVVLFNKISFEAPKYHFKIEFALSEVHTLKAAQLQMRLTIL